MRMFAGYRTLFLAILLQVAFSIPLDIESGTRDGDSVEVDLQMEERLGYLVDELRTSLLVPLLFNPLQITKLTCGSLITFYDAGVANPTVAVDVCLVSVLLLKLLYVVPTLISALRLDQEGGIFNVLDAIAYRIDRLDLAGTGPEGEPILLEKAAEKEAKVPTKQEIEDKHSSQVLPAMIQKKEGEPQKNVQGPTEYPDSYTGFGFSGWSSGVQKIAELTSLISRQGFNLPELAEFPEETSPKEADNDKEIYDYLPRSFASGGIDDLVSILREFRHAVKIESRH